MPVNPVQSLLSSSRDAKSMLATAHALEQIALELTLRAEQAERQNTTPCDLLDALRASSYAQELIRHGIPSERARALALARFPIDPHTLDFHLQRLARREDKKNREARRNAILKMQRRGLSQREIARKLGLTQARICQLIKA